MNAWFAFFVCLFWFCLVFGFFFVVVFFLIIPVFFSLVSLYSFPVCMQSTMFGSDHCSERSEVVCGVLNPRELHWEGD